MRGYKKKNSEGPLVMGRILTSRYWETNRKELISGRCALNKGPVWVIWREIQFR